MRTKKSNNGRIIVQTRLDFSLITYSSIQEKRQCHSHNQACHSWRGPGGTARSDPWKPKITFLSKTHLEVLRNVKNMNF